VATDMSPAYIDAVTTHLKKATLVFEGALRFCRSHAALFSGVAKALLVRTCQCFDL
jgi:hypothetical protein